MWKRNLLMIIAFSYHLKASYSLSVPSIIQTPRQLHNAHDTYHHRRLYTPARYQQGRTHQESRLYNDNAPSDPNASSATDKPHNDSFMSGSTNEKIEETNESVLIYNDESIMNERDNIRNFGDDLGEYNPSRKLPIKREVLVGDPQQRLLKDKPSVTNILKELAAIQAQGPQKYCILGTRHCSFLHQQIIELLSYALVLSENHVYTSGAMGTNAAAIRGALRAKNPDLLTVILPQSLSKQPKESQELLKDVNDLVTMPQNDEMSLDVASRICNSKLLSETDQLVAFAFHESTTVIEATKEAKQLEMLVTTLFLD